MESDLLNNDRKQVELIQSKLQSTGPRQNMVNIALNCTSSAIIGMNRTPDVSQLNLPQKSNSDLRNEILWTQSWLKSGAKRSTLANHFFC